MNNLKHSQIGGKSCWHISVHDIPGFIDVGDISGLLTSHISIFSLLKSPLSSKIYQLSKIGRRDFLFDFCLKKWSFSIELHVMGGRKT